MATYGLFQLRSTAQVFLVKFTMNSLFRAAVRNFLLRFGFQVLSLPRIVELTTSRIGSFRSSVIFSEFLVLRDAGLDDQLLSSFIEFCARNWKASYSQYSQDLFVMFFSRGMNGGRYLEVGGADGYTNSNTLSLHQFYAWHGILVEPDPVQFKILSKVRPRDQLINKAISPTGSTDDLKLRRAWQLSALSGYEGSDNHYDIRMKSSDLVSVQSISLTSLLAHESIDYFSLDVEGAEVSILRSIDWDLIFKPSFVTVEHNGRSSDSAEILSIMGAAGYSQVFSGYHWLTEGDFWFVLPEYLP